MRIHSANLLDVQDQTLILLQNAYSLIDEVINNDGVKVQGGLVSDDFLKKANSTLRNEHQKAKNLEMVIAVVGTMKAGKSTTINAIVGHEVLPNRNYPMTALPTVVSHVKGKKIPILSFPNSQPISDLSKKVAQKIKSLTQAEIIKKDFLNNKEVESLKTELSEHGEFHFPEVNEGQDAIFSFLKDLNDLMRLANELDIEPPYEAYSLIDDLPTIEVEFHHLSEKKENQHGKLSILDTPGPNEFGQSEALKGIFTDQLQKASAVLLVVDYTQMNSEAGGDVHKEISKIQDSLGDRFYVMLNKFDAKGTNDASKEDTVEFFCNQLMDGKIEKEHVFPVSAKKAFLANRALVEIDTNGSLNAQEGWVAEFGEIAFGEDWPEDIEDSDDVLKKASRIWKKTEFSIPLEKVISEANSSAAFLSLESALDQLDAIIGQLGDGINGFNTSLTIDVKKLKSIIASIEQDNERVEKIKKDTQEYVSSISSKLEEKINTYTQASINRSQKDVDQFLSGSWDEKEKQHQQKKDKVKQTRFSGILGRLEKTESEVLKEALSRDIIIYEKDEKDKANAVIKAINTKLRAIQSSTFNDIQVFINENIDNSEEQINREINSLLQNTINKARERLGDSGLSLSVSLEGLNSAGAKSVSSSKIKSAVKKDKENRSFSRVKSSYLGRFANFFNDDWGRETYTMDVDVFKINIPDVKRQSKAIMNESVKNISIVATDYLDKKVKNNINDHIGNITSYLEKYRKTLIAGINGQKKTQEKKEALVATLRNYNTKIQVIKDDSKDSKQELALLTEGAV